MQEPLRQLKLPRHRLGLDLAGVVVPPRLVLGHVTQVGQCGDEDDVVDGGVGQVVFDRLQRGRGRRAEGRGRGRGLGEQHQATEKRSKGKETEINFILRCTVNNVNIGNSCCFIMLS